ncbi:MAG: NAD+ synthase [Bacteroidetes Order II. Incertae sedis bacterium]|nr:NAD+ synthase [Bacteroidetes Order II. bacterium]
MRIALAQINPIVGDLPGNVQKILDVIREAAQNQSELVVFSELVLCGYPPMDLLDNPLFIEACAAAIQQIARESPPNIAVILGTPVRNPKTTGKRLYNAAVLLEKGEVAATAYKVLLPTYDVFDEYRYFEPADVCTPIVWRGIRLGLHICEDMWNNEAWAQFHLYDRNPIDELAAAGTDIFINISGSPYSHNQSQTRDRLIIENCREHQRPFLYVNQVGANTEIIFDGDSCAFDVAGNMVLELPRFREALAYLEFDPQTRLLTPMHPETAHTPAPDRIRDLHDALVLGIHDYFHKSGFFKKALIGLSGGIDSAVTCALAVHALGADKVMGVTMPSKYSSSGSVTDSEALARATGIEFLHIPIVPAVSAFDEMLADVFAGHPPDVAEENIQARVRGTTLMALSNKFNHLLLTTGNKSEMAVGYCTLYGDMNGGLAVLSDVFKMDVYALASYINQKAGHEVVPESTIQKAPSAELRPGQKDQDSLPPYPVLDEILRRYIEEWQELETISDETGYPYDTVSAMLRKVDANEFKRKQAAPGLRVTRKAFGTGRRLPIVMRWDRRWASEMTGADQEETPEAWE